MALQFGALHKAGVDEPLVREAAEEVAGYENRLGGIERQFIQLRADVDQRFNGVDRRIDELRAYMDQRFAVADGGLNLLTWMLGLVRHRAAGAVGSRACKVAHLLTGPARGAPT